ncbi:hypothetical protein CAEBREN_18330 [Caenorhabditis brenneri]|uniref:Uncharacterized protein n=1 Tax=Caenorhabditis brenneri TaxID=135651 RepID=G0NM94_CAEBE|nr:hypothetical protein CAEBREN_18330 [Caenorhabditis brenneri]
MVNNVNETLSSENSRNVEISKNSELEKTIEKIQRDLTKANEKIEQLTTENKGIADQKMSTEAENGVLRSDKTLLQESVAVFQSKNNELEKTVEKTQSNLTQANEKIEQLTTANTEFSKPKMVNAQMQQIQITASDGDAKRE